MSDVREPESTWPRRHPLVDGAVFLALVSLVLAIILRAMDDPAEILVDVANVLRWVCGGLAVSALVVGMIGFLREQTQPRSRMWGIAASGQLLAILALAALPVAGAVDNKNRSLSEVGEEVALAAAFGLPFLMSELGDKPLDALEGTADDEQDDVPLEDDESDEESDDYLEDDESMEEDYDYLEDDEDYSDDGLEDAPSAEDYQLSEEQLRDICEQSANEYYTVDQCMADLSQ